MPGPAEPDVTRLLLAWRNGDDRALEQLIPLVYSELRRLAHRQMRGERPGHLLQTTALVNEAYMRLSRLDRIDWQDRVHFVRMASRLMREILVDHARRHGAGKRGGVARGRSFGQQQLRHQRQRRGTFEPRLQAQRVAELNFECVADIIFDGFGARH